MFKNIVKNRIIKINSYLNSMSLSTNKSIIRILIFSILFLLPFYYLDGISSIPSMPNVELKIVMSKWSLLLIIALILILLGIYLLFIIKYKRKEYIIYLACAGTYLSIQFYALALSKTKYLFQSINTNKFKYYIFLIILNVLLVLWNIFFKDNIKSIDEKKNLKYANKYRNISYILLLLVIALHLFIIYKISNSIFNLNSVLYILGFIELFHLEYFLDYYIACKYTKKLELFNDEENK